ncbi:hypothetical protein HOU02_gp191 [Caulobacter phage CcrBL9]|uniref:Uncharacterized protein n=1 Tax=Caulobacter phage CcrBL9 TaxID=2283270 RepID=A0A385ECC2_9CAUD|nr:hypothetical protein HOU02_gp191 [Caulobacter phage CcrBL9]AXQ69534.1 hypothetical protein CcrBL9_gp510 [Caulobacter phage CcrBL9]
MTFFTVQPYRVRQRKTRLKITSALDRVDLMPRPTATVHPFAPKKKRARLTGPYQPVAGHTQPYRVIGGVHPVYDECFATADHVYEEPRGPQIVPTGILDERGVMLCRVTMPIKQQLGINTGGNAWTGEFEDEVEALMPADMLRISTGGGGVSEIDASEFDEDFEDEDED